MGKVWKVEKWEGGEGNQVIGKHLRSHINVTYYLTLNTDRALTFEYPVLRKDDFALK